MISSTRLGLARMSSSSAMRLDDRDVLVLDLLALQRGEATQLHLEDRVGLDLREAEAGHQVLARASSTSADSRMVADDRVEVVEGDLEALEDVRPVARLLEVELGAPPHDLAAPVDVVLEDAP